MDPPNERSTCSERFPGLADHLCVNEGDVNVMHSCGGGIHVGYNSLDIIRKILKLYSGIG